MTLHYPISFLYSIRKEFSLKHKDTFVNYKLGKGSKENLLILVKLSGHKHFKLTVISQRLTVTNHQDDKQSQKSTPYKNIRPSSTRFYTVGKV